MRAICVARAPCRAAPRAIWPRDPRVPLRFPLRGGSAVRPPAPVPRAAPAWGPGHELHAPCLARSGGIAPDGLPGLGRVAAIRIAASVRCAGTAAGGRECGGTAARHLGPSLHASESAGLRVSRPASQSAGKARPPSLHPGATWLASLRPGFRVERLSFRIADLLPEQAIESDARAKRPRQPRPRPGPRGGAAPRPGPAGGPAVGGLRGAGARPRRLLRPRARRQGPRPLAHPPRPALLRQARPFP